MQTDAWQDGDLYEPYVGRWSRAVASQFVDWLGLPPAKRWLDVGCGTGALSETILVRTEPSEVRGVDRSEGFVKYATQHLDDARFDAQVGDARSLPFDDAAFDAVVCQFGVMFFPDRGAAFAEMHRVLRPGGSALFNVWDRIEANEFAHVVSDAVAALFPDDPPQFLARVPHGYPDPHRIRADLAIGGFEMSPDIEVVDARSHAPTCAAPAIGFCQGTPLRAEIEARDPSRLDAATEAATAAVAERFGETDIDAGMRALIVTAAKD